MVNQISRSTDAAAAGQLGPVAQAVLNQEILEAMGLGMLPEAEKNSFYQTMIATVNDRVIARVLDELSANERQQLMRFLDRNQPDEAEAFIGEHVPELNTLVVQEALLYKAEMIENARHVHQVLGIQADDAVAAEPPTLPTVVADALPAVVPAAAPPALYHPD